MRKRDNNKILVIGVVFVVAVLLVIAVLFAYKRGEDAGRAAVDAKVVTLAEAVQKKADCIEKLGGLAEEWRADTETIDKEGIDRYVEKLRGLASEADGEVKTALENYLAAWEKLQEVYDGQDNSAIMEAFEKIKTSAAETAEILQETLDEGIEQALDELGK